MAAGALPLDLDQPTRAAEPSKAWPDDSVPRCRRDALDSYVGFRRRPERADELGAEWVIDAVFGGRLAFHPYAKDWFWIARLP